MIKTLNRTSFLTPFVILLLATVLTAGSSLAVWAQGVTESNVAAAKKDGLSATELIQRMDSKLRGAQSRADITMTIVRPSWERSIRMKTWSLGTEYSMILITEPARDQGIAYLKRDNEIWNWVPNIGRTIKLPPSMMMQSWMGSDFTNDDLVRESSVVTDYTHSFGEDADIDGYQTYQVILTPKPDAPVVWGEVRTWVTREEYIQLKTEFYDEEGYLVSTMQASEIKDFQGRKLASRMEMIPLDEPGNKTILTYNDLSFEEAITESFFNVQQMRRLR
jgi:outer membrane lipoprotein-sorting protein